MKNLSEESRDEKSHPIRQALMWLCIGLFVAGSLVRATIRIRDMGEPNFEEQRDQAIQAWLESPEGQKALHGASTPGSEKFKKIMDDAKASVARIQETMQQSKPAVDQVLKCLREDRLDELYDATTAAFQAATRRDDLGAYLVKHPHLKLPGRLTNFESTRNEAGQKAHRYDFVAEAGSGRRNGFQITLIQVGDKWLVNNLSARD